MFKHFCRLVFVGKTNFILCENVLLPAACCLHGKVNILYKCSYGPTKYVSFNICNSYMCVFQFVFAHAKRITIRSGLVDESQQQPNKPRKKMGEH